MWYVLKARPEVAEEHAPEIEYGERAGAARKKTRHSYAKFLAGQQQLSCATGPRGTEASIMVQ